MLLEDYYSENTSGISFTRKQASSFAKGIADDFNPIHDEQAKLFCVPGDLLFAITLNRFGLNQKMCFTFSGMVSDQLPLSFSSSTDSKRVIVDDNGKEYLTIEHQGDRTTDRSLISQFTQNYVKFSGHNFENVLLPLMQEHGVMLNPQRPLVMYQNMSVELNTLDLPGIELELAQAELEVNGKKGEVKMEFCLTSAGEVVGRGFKRMAIRGLQPFDSASVNQMLDDYMSYKAAYHSSPKTTSA